MQQQILEAVLEALQSLKQSKLATVNGDNINIFLAPQDIANVNALTVPSPIVEKATVCVKKLFHTSEGYLGTFVFVHKHIGICPFHCVVRGRRVLDGTSLRVDGCALKHLSSHPYYELSFYEVDKQSDVPYLELGNDSAIQRGSKFYVAAYPAVDEASSKSLQEDVLVTHGRVVRVHSVTGSDFVAGAYDCCKGSSGGAILDTDGKLIGMHVQNEYAEDTTYFKPVLTDIKYPEAYYIKAPSTYIRYGRANHDEARFLSESAINLARYAASNVNEKSAFGCFLPVGVIKKKLDSLLLEVAWEGSESENDMEH